MTELDLTAAVRAVITGIAGTTAQQLAVSAVKIAAPIIEKAVREQVAREIEAEAGLRCPQCGLETHLRDGNRYWCQDNHLWEGGGSAMGRRYAALARGGGEASRG